MLSKVAAAMKTMSVVIRIATSGSARPGRPIIDRGFSTVFLASCVMVTFKMENNVMACKRGRHAIKMI